MLLDVVGMAGSPGETVWAGQQLLPVKYFQNTSLLECPPYRCSRFIMLNTVESCRWCHAGSRSVTVNGISQKLN